MKHIKLFEHFLNEASKDAWSFITSGPITIVRFSGKTFPQISYSETDKVIYARDNNGPRPSESLKTSDITVEAVKGLLDKISKPHPTDETLNKFIDKIKKIK